MRAGNLLPREADRLPRRTLPLALVALLSLLAPLALAGESQVDFEVRAPLLVDGSGALHSNGALLAYLPPDGSGIPHGLEWASARGELLEGRPNGSHRVVETFDLGPGRLDGWACAVACGLALHADEPGSTLGLQGELRGAIGLTRADPTHVRAPPLAGLPSIDEGLAIPLHGMGLNDIGDHTWPFASGNVTLVLWNATAHIATGEGDRQVDARSRGSASPDGGGPEPAARAVQLHLSGARLDVEVNTQGYLLLPAPQLDLAGRLHVRDAEGTLPPGSPRAAGKNETTTFDGEGHYRLESGSQEGRLRLVGSLDGDVTLHGLVAGPRFSGLVGALRAGAFAGGAVTAAGLLLWAASSPLYFRIARSKILANENRRRIYELIKEEPGLTRREIADAADVAPSVAGYHLQKLREYRFIACRRVGRNPTYFVPEADVDAEEVAASHLLRNPTRRDLALALLEHEAPPSQRDLVETTGISQRLVSYHLRKLLDVGLVSACEGPPARYEPTDRLQDVLTDD